MEDRVSALLARIERLEASNGRQRIMSLIAVSVCSMLVLTAATSSSSSSQGPITIRGTSGRSIVINGDEIKFLDSAKTTRLWVGFSPDYNVPFINFNDSSHTTRVSIGLASSGDPSLSFYGAGGKKELVTGTNETGPTFEMYDHGGTERAYVGSFTSGNYGAFFADRSGTRYWSQP